MPPRKLSIKCSSEKNRFSLYNEQGTFRREYNGSSSNENMVFCWEKRSSRKQLKSGVFDSKVESEYLKLRFSVKLLKKINLIK